MQYEKNIQFEDLDSNLQIIAELIGIENTLKLVKTMGGIQLYVPKYECVIKSARNKAIKKDYNGFNCRSLSKKYGLSEMQIRNIVLNSRKG
jgi:Mor family transcriptional regulator